MTRHTRLAAPVFLLALAALLLAGPGWSQEGAPGVPAEVVEGDFFPDWEGPEFAGDGLGLSEDQKNRMRDLRQSFRKDRIRATAESRIRRMELVELMRSDNPDRAAIARKLEENAAAHTAQILARFDNRQAMRALLTPEQIGKMKEMRKARRGRRGPRARMRHGRRGGAGMGGPGMGRPGMGRPGMGRSFRQGRRPHGDQDCPCRMGPGRGGPKGHGQGYEGAAGDPGESPIL